MLKILVVAVHNVVARSFYIPRLDKRRLSLRNTVPLRASVIHTYEILTS
jgi:hypothetical protein